MACRKAASIVRLNSASRRGGLRAQLIDELSLLLRIAAAALLATNVPRRAAFPKGRRPQRS
jgi:hypothetical protein